MAKSVYEFWLSFGNGKEKLRLPVIPGVLNVSNSSKNESVDISKLGEATIIQDPAAKMFNFSSHFPLDVSPLVEYADILLPWDYIKIIERWKSSGKPIRFLVTGTTVNFPVSIEDFSYREGEKDIGDYDYDIILKEFKFVAARKVERGKQKAKTTRPNDKNSSKSYVVKKGDTLIAIARKHYGDSSRWRDIYALNKTEIDKRDKRNFKQPGHWIHIGAKLRLPV